MMTVIKFQTDAELVALANDCPFGLGSNVFSSNRRRANAIARQLQAYHHQSDNNNNNEH